MRFILPILNPLAQVSNYEIFNQHLLDSKVNLALASDHGQVVVTLSIPTASDSAA